MELLKTTIVNPWIEKYYTMAYNFQNRSML
jgi:hypothetical protein